MEYFNISEFDSPDLPGSGEIMDETFLDMLDEARDIAGIAFKITSGVRSKAHNEKVGGVSNSSHLRGYACDIACSSSSDKYTILNSLLEVGFNRIGIAKGFIHVDNDPDKSPFVIWTY